MIVLGHPSYYPRLGFVPATAMGIYPPEGADIPSEAWMAKPLTQYAANMSGTVAYSSDFIETGSVPGPLLAVRTDPHRMRTGEFHTLIDHGVLGSPRRPGR